MNDGWRTVTLSTLWGSRMCGRQRTCGKFSCRQVVTPEVEMPRSRSDRCGLSGSSAKGDKLRSDRNALGDFHANHRFERFQLAGV